MDFYTQDRCFIAYSARQCGKLSDSHSERNVLQISLEFQHM